MNALDFTASAFLLYGVTKIVTASHAGRPIRKAIRWMAFHFLPIVIRHNWVKVETLEGGQERPVMEDDADMDLTHERDIKGYSFAECPVCMGPWLSCTFYIWTSSIFWVLAIYGAMLFLEMIDQD